MVETTVVRTIRVKGTSEGIDKLTGDLTKLAGAQENVAVVSEQSAKRALSIEASYKRLSMQVDENFRAQEQIARSTKVADQALQQGLITQQQHANTLQLIQQRYAVAGKATEEFGKQTGLARHDLINLGRQLQDVGVSLASGQSPFTVLAQQGSQIADVFISSGKSVGSFFSQALGWAGRFFTSTAGIVTGIGAIGAAAVYAATQFATSQKTTQELLDEENRLHKQGTELINAKTEAQKRYLAVTGAQQQFEQTRLLEQMEIRYKDAVLETIKALQRRSTTPSQVAGEMGEAPTGLAPSQVAGLKEIAELAEQMKTALDGGAVSMKAVNEQLSRLGINRPELGKIIEDFIKANEKVVELEQSIKRTKDDMAKARGPTEDQQAQQRLKYLQEEYELIRAGSEAERERLRARQEYDRLIGRGVSPGMAGKITAQMQENARAFRDARDATESWSVQHDRAVERANAMAGAAEEATIAMNAFAGSMFNAANAATIAANAFVPFSIRGAGEAPGALSYTLGQDLFQSKQGGFSQFNPAGYTSLHPAAAFSLLQAQAMEKTWGAENVERKTVTFEMGPSSFSYVTAQMKDQNAKYGFKELGNSVKKLTDAVNDNTDMLKTQADPLFSQGHEFINQLKIGYYKAATGLTGVVTGTGGPDSTPVHMMLTPGETVQVLPPEWARGRTVSNDNSRNVHVTQNIIVNESRPVDRLTARQRAQGFIKAATMAVG